MDERWNERRSIGGINLRYLAKPSPSSLSRDQQFVNFLNLSTRSPYEVIVYSPWSCTRFEGARLSRNTIDRSTHSSLVGGEEEEEEEEEYKKKNIKRRRCENKKKRMQEETVRTRWFPLPPPFCLCRYTREYTTRQQNFLYNRPLPPYKYEHTTTAHVYIATLRKDY